MEESRIKAEIETNKLIAIIRGLKAVHVEPLVAALVAGGIRLLEFTFDYSDPQGIEKTCSLIRLAQSSFGDQVLVGAGTVLTVEAVEAAAAAGAHFMISPDVSPEVIKATKALKKISIPGALTPSEVVQAHKLGADYVKLFPAGELGVGYISSLAAPLPHIPMMAVGGITPENVSDFMKTGIRGVGIGSCLVDLKAIEAGDFNSITETARKFITIISGFVKLR